MDHATLAEKFNALGRPEVALVGDFMLDEYLYGDAERISPEAPVPVLRVVRTEQLVGGAGGVAADLVALGAKVHCVGVVGHDEAGQTIRRQLAALGCTAEGLVTVAGRASTRKTRLVGLAQHRHRQQLLRVDHEQTDALDGPARSQLLAAATTAIERCGVLLLQDYNKGVLSAELISQLIAVARKKGVPVLVDPARIPDYSRYRGATLITPNRWEASLAAGEQIAELKAGPNGSPADTSQLARVAARLIQAAGLEHVVITLDREGAFLGHRDGSGQLLATRQRTVYDNTGAGDMVLAVLGLCWAARLTPDESVALANVAGGLEVEKFGSVPIARDELAAELRAMERGSSKLWELPLLAAEVQRLHAAGRKVCFTNGCFDILHAGHVKSLQFARAQGDALIVAINSDASVQKLKGPTRPICSQDIRAAVLSALACVDYVTIFDEDTPLNVIAAVQPDILVKGSQYDNQFIAGRDIVESRGGRVVLVDMLQGESTTNTIEKIIKAHQANGKTS